MQRWRGGGRTGEGFKKNKLPVTRGASPRDPIETQSNLEHGDYSSQHCSTSQCCGEYTLKVPIKNNTKVATMCAGRSFCNEDMYPIILFDASNQYIMCQLHLKSFF